MSLKIGIICASDTELAPFLPQIKNSITTRHCRLQCFEGTIGTLPVAALYSGVCKVNAAIATQVLIDRFQVDAVINAGTAGGMDKTVDLFDTIVSTKTAYHDVADDILTEFHPWLPSIYFDSDPNLLALAKKAAEKSPHTIRFGVSVTGEQFIEDARRAEINRKFAPLSVDMEAAGVAHVCYANQVPFISIRTITDTAAHSGIETFDRNCEVASEIARDVVLSLLEELA